jgi:site-specific recombinase XerD
MEPIPAVLEGKIRAYLTHLRDEEKSANTLGKYGRDIRRLAAFSGVRAGEAARGADISAFLTKETLRAYKEELCRSYAATSVNSMLAAANGFLSFLGLGALRLKRLRIQKKAFCAPDEELSRAEYDRLLETTDKNRRSVWKLILQTICATGIRVSELAYITAEAARAGRAYILCKGKAREIFIPTDLRRLLLDYIDREKLSSGSIFLTRGGKPPHRANIWREMKKLGRAAGLPAAKVFPHNLRRLFARVYYGLANDIVKLADLLRHSDMRTTQLYIMSSGREHARQLNKMKLVRPELCPTRRPSAPARIRAAT